MSTLQSSVMTTRFTLMGHLIISLIKWCISGMAYLCQAGVIFGFSLPPGGRFGTSFGVSACHGLHLLY